VINVIFNNFSIMYIMVVKFIVGGNQREPTNFLQVIDQPYYTTL